MASQAAVGALGGKLGALSQAPCANSTRGRASSSSMTSSSSLCAFSSGPWRLASLRLPSSRLARGGAKMSLSVVAAKSSSTESTTQDPSVAASELLKTVLDTWEKVDDKLAIGGLGFSGLILLWASTGLIGAIDKLPLIPDFFEIVGILFTGWFVYRYLLFKPDREELLKIIDETKGKVTGQ